MKTIKAKSILVLLSIAYFNVSKAQVDNSSVNLTEKSPNSTIQENQQKDINKLDHKKRREGDWEFYWDDSNTLVASKGKFRNGRQIGKWSYYNQEGKLERTEINRRFSKKMKTTQYYPNGKVEKEGMAKVVMDKEYVNYYWVGNWKCYDEFGNYVKTEKYVKGELVEK